VRVSTWSGKVKEILSATRPAERSAEQANGNQSPSRIN
jgi:hypothetical protein